MLIYVIEMFICIRLLVINKCVYTMWSGLDVRMYVQMFQLLVTMCNVPLRQPTHTQRIVD